MIKVRVPSDRWVTGEWFIFSDGRRGNGLERDLGLSLFHELGFWSFIFAFVYFLFLGMNVNGFIASSWVKTGLLGQLWVGMSISS